MAAAAQLAGEIADLDDANGLTVFLAEQRRHARLASRIKRGLVDARCVAHMICSLATRSTSATCSGRHGLEMGEIETKAIGADVAARLLDVIAEHLAQRSVQNVRGGVVALNAGAQTIVNRGGDDVAHLERTLADLNVVHVKTRLGSLGIAHARASRCIEHDAGIADLAAHLSVEGVTSSSTSTASPAEADSMRSPSRTIAMIFDSTVSWS